MAVPTNTRVAKKDATTAYAALNYTDGVRIYKSNNCGVSWSRISIQSSITDTVTAIGVIPNTDIVLLSTCFGDTWKIYKSVDGGINFTLTGSRTVYTGNGITKSAFCVLGSGVIITEIPMPEDNTTGNYYICRSTDSGSSWSYIKLGNSLRPFSVMNIIEVASGIVLTTAVVYGNPSMDLARIARSTDAGLTWSFPADVYVFPVPYISYTQLSNGKIFWTWSTQIGYMYSTDLGVNWTSQNTPFYIARLTSTRNRLIASSTDSKIYISDNEGANWQQVATTGSPIIDFVLF
jgi:photosystem II stability/assembly factor-like uncharacterized protein